MPNSLGPTGLILQTQAELIAFYTTSYQTIYGADVVLTSDTPDGQMMNLQIQAVLDLQDLVMQVYNSFDPDNAFGVVLDQRVAINGIQRQVGTFTITNVTITNSQSINLYGLDQTAQPVYTVADGAGNQWQLQVTRTGLSPAANALPFQAATPGAVVSVPNTITVPVTIVLGVTSINNPTTYTVLGINEESDAELKVRRQKSTAFSTQGYYNGLLAALGNVPGVSYAFIEENDTGTDNADNVPGHSIWVIVAGSGANADIAQAIYTKRNAGCGMYNSGDAGAMSYAVVQADGSTFTVYWDTVIAIPLFITLTAVSLDKLNPPNIAAITSALPVSFTPGVAAQVNINDLATLVQDADPNTLVTTAGFNFASPQVMVLSGSTSSGSGSAKLSYAGASTGAITPSNWTAANLQTQLRTLTADTALTVTGTSLSGPFTVTFVNITAPSLIGVNTNSLETSGSAPITFNFLSTYASTLKPKTKNNQFTVSATDVIVLTMILAAPVGTIGIAYNINSTTGVVTNTTLSIANTLTFTFLGLGGYGALVYTVSSGTGSSINASTGAYIAGSAGTDTVTVTDAMGHSAFCTVTIT